MRMWSELCSSKQFTDDNRYCVCVRCGKYVDDEKPVKYINETILKKLY